MTDETVYTPPKVWTWNKENGGQFANINRPVAGPTHDKDLPVGRHPLQLHSLATPNGIKVTVMLEELLAAGHSGAEYDAWLIPIPGDARRVPVLAVLADGQRALFGRRLWPLLRLRPDQDRIRHRPLRHGGEAP